MSSSGLIYAVIVGAWAAYLVPMWLRRQDELNEARPTERFSTAIRLLSGRAAMERRYARELEQREARDGRDRGAGPAEDSGDLAYDRHDPDLALEPDPLADFDAVDVRAFADPVTAVHHTASLDGPPPADEPGEAPAPPHGADGEPRPRPAGPQQRRAKLLARRRRTTMVLFLAFTGGAVLAAVGGVAFLWAPAVPAVLLSAYIAHMRRQERRRFAQLMDRRRAEEAARRLREQERRRRAARQAAEPTARPTGGPTRGAGTHPGPPTAGGRASGRPRTGHPVSEAERRALVEQTDHAEWLDQERERDRSRAGGEGWEPTPVPLPTYVNAPVAPRHTPGVDLDAPDTWSSARSGPVPPPVPGPAATPPPRSSRQRPAAATPAATGSPGTPRKRQSRPERRSRARTPLYDQYADEDRPRAANE